jgi:hypothetical protein
MDAPERPPKNLDVDQSGTSRTGDDMGSHEPLLPVPPIDTDERYPSPQDETYERTGDTPERDKSESRALDARTRQSDPTCR